MVKKKITTESADVVMPTEVETESVKKSVKVKLPMVIETPKVLEASIVAVAPLVEEVKVVVEKPTNRVVMQPQRQQQPSRDYQPPQQYQRQLTPKPPMSDPNMKLEAITGVLDILQDGQGFVRPKFTPSIKDSFLAAMQVRRYNLRPGDMLTGVAKAPMHNEKHWSIVRIDKVNGMELASANNRLDFKDLVPIYPQKQLKLEFDPETLSTRIIDLFSPIGFGQRGMIVSPPKAGKTTLLKEIAAGVAANHPEVHLMAVLVGERPEEVTDMQRFIKGEVIASHFDQKPEEQTRAAEIAIERAKRLVELGKDVFIVFDSITRLARAYNLAIPTSGRTLSGGFDPAALYPSKRFFGAARKIENGGSLTIIGTALVDTGSKMDDLVFEEFKGTGNMELKLERRLAERRIFPAFDILKSGTRKEELLLELKVLERIMGIRRMFDALGDREDTGEVVIEQMRKTKTNQEFLDKIGKK
ncbi:transcription termination factor Rho [Candidatus Shapirobacteria bacterium]|nr:transcription termination factor Rho [Candidatus Shapirobacteria bacterium]